MIIITNIHKLKQTYSHRHIAYFWVLFKTTNYLFMPYYRTGFLIETFSYTNRLLKIAGLASISHSCTDWFHQMNLYLYNSNRSRVLSTDSMVYIAWTFAIEIDIQYVIVLRKMLQTKNAAITFLHFVSISEYLNMFCRFCVLFFGVMILRYEMIS